LSLSVSPNPATSQVTLSYTLTAQSQTTIEIRDALQRVVAQPLTAHVQEVGTYAIVVPLAQLTSGIYTVQVTTLSSEGQVLRAVKQLILTR
jgi:hypothetical protein